MTAMLLGPEKRPCEGDPARCANRACTPDSPLFGGGRESRDGKFRVKACLDPVGQGKANKRSGQKAQKNIARRLGVEVGMGGGNEENWRAGLRVEVKSGAQAGPVITRYLAAKTQSDASRAFGDHRPFGFFAVHQGLELLVVDVNDLPNVLEALANTHGGIT